MDRSIKNIELFSDPSLLSYRGAELFKEQSNRNCKGFFRVALAGGNTPKKMYEILASEPFLSQIEWNKIEIFFGDERLVPLNHPDSNFCMANEVLLKNIPIPKENIHPVLVSSDKTPEEIALDYEKEIWTIFNILPPEVPVFDLIILGMGKDGHTASIFPHSNALLETKQLSLAVLPPPNVLPNILRITLTPPVLLNAKQIMVLISGLEKANTWRRVLQELNNTDELPIKMICPLGNRVTWLLDSFAAG